ncbi:MAG: hypothetical protein NC331_06020 [Lachnospiraceae bacterium]|nr:hypothetical protein [Lachnospiraceae bacterium]MCM1238925.1 hypothetical protein [Lachnospiraceae bacterium]MCM1342760.1 hypothetical protein [Muribaculaceae bacterium]MCM1409976.1 hypothetical protein [Lachnospiraceae bacterium]
MKKFDRKMKKRFKDLEVPPSYDEKVDQLLVDIMKKEPILEKKKRSRPLLRLAVCLLCILCVVSLYTVDAKANIFETFKETIMDFLGRGNSQEDIAEMGVETEKQLIESKPDLMMELQESVIDSHSIYLMVKITASSGIRFEEDVLFDYFCFCKGTNYSAYQLLSGAISCELLEVNEDRPNIATYVISLVFDETLEEGAAVTACFRDLTKDPYSDSPKLLVEGLWSITFDFYPTVTDRIEIEGTPDMVFPFINTTAEVMNIELTPFGLMVRADVSRFPSDELGVSDNSIAIRLKMIDGSELTVASHDLEEDCYTQSGSVSVSNEGDKTYQQMNLEFTNMINVGKVMGIYIEDLYIPFK